MGKTYLVALGAVLLTSLIVKAPQGKDQLFEYFVMEISSLTEKPFATYNARRPRTQ